MNRKRIFLALRIAGSLLFCVFIIINTEWAEVFKITGQLKFRYFLGGLVLTVIGLMVKALRWSLILKPGAVGYFPLLKMYFIGQYYNFFLPGSVGGDLSRALRAGSAASNCVLAFYSVVMERLTGFFALGLISLFALYLWDPGDSRALRDYLLKAASVIVILLALFFFIRVPVFIRALVPQSVKRLPDIIKRIFEIKKAFNAFTGSFIFIRVLGLSLLFHFIWIGAVYSAALSLNIGIDFFYYWIFFPLIQFAGALPVSLNGIGIQEGAFIYFFGLAGLNSATGLSLGLAFRMLNIFPALIGMFFVYRD